MLKSIFRFVKSGDIVYPTLAFVCPGCREFGGTGLHMVPVNTEKKSPSWSWDRIEDKPTLEPSLMTARGTDQQCHSFLRRGCFEFLPDSKHSLAGQTVEMPDLPEWFINEEGGTV